MSAGHTTSARALHDAAEQVRSGRSEKAVNGKEMPFSYKKALIISILHINKAML